MTEASDTDTSDGSPVRVSGNGHDAAVVAEASEPAGTTTRLRTRHDPAVIARARELAETTTLPQTEHDRRTAELGHGARQLDG